VAGDVAAERHSPAEEDSAGLVAAVFPGQGSQQEEMRPAVAAVAPELIVLICEAVGEDPFERLQDGTQFVQPAIFCRSMASWFELREVLEPAAFGGHSMGEVAALVAAGALSVTDGAHVIAARGALTAACVGTGGMLAAMGLAPEVVEQIAARRGAHIANYNSRRQVVVAGTAAALDAVGSEVVERGGQAVRIPVAGAFHSPAMAGATAGYAELLQRIRFRPTSRPVYSCASGRVFTDPRRESVRGLTMPVRWVDVVMRIRASGVARFVECEPGHVLAGLIKRITGPRTVSSAADALAARKTIENRQRASAQEL
jgi:[acyl-carrier-protein] S-malonyltransferase